MSNRLKLKFEGGEVGFINFAEAVGVRDEAFASLDFDVIRSIRLTQVYPQ